MWDQTPITWEQYERCFRTHHSHVSFEAFQRKKESVCLNYIIEEFYFAMPKFFNKQIVVLLITDVDLFFPSPFKLTSKIEY